jgi:hypothetical protein
MSKGGSVLVLKGMMGHVTIWNTSKRSLYLMSAGQLEMGPSKKFYLEWVSMYWSEGTKF